jgi:hypothetical protein
MVIHPGTTTLPTPASTPQESLTPQDRRTAPTKAAEEVVTRVDIIKIRKPIITIETGSMELRSRFSVETTTSPN